MAIYLLFDFAPANFKLVEMSSDNGRSLCSVYKTGMPDEAFSRGTMVEAHSLQSVSLNGLEGMVMDYAGDRAVVQFDGHGRRTINTANLRTAEDHV